MRCPKCAHLEDRVIDSRGARSGAVIRRRRICARCGHRFTTYEEIVKAKLRVIKRDGRHEDFDRQKLVNGILRACEKRPIGIDQVDAMVDAIMDALEAEYDREVPTEAVGRKVMERLKEVDEVAYVRFASVYRRFRDVNEFLNAVQGLITKE